MSESEKQSVSLKIVMEGKLHEEIVNYIDKNDIVIGEYDDMKNLVLKMISCGYMFNMERDRLRDAMEDITYMMNPGDDVNKDRVSRGLEYDDDESDDEMDVLSEIQKVADMVKEVEE